MQIFCLLYSIQVKGEKLLARPLLHRLQHETACRSWRAATGEEPVGPSPLTSSTQTTTGHRTSLSFSADNWIHVLFLIKTLTKTFGRLKWFEIISGILQNSSFYWISVTKIIFTSNIFKEFKIKPQINACSCHHHVFFFRCIWTAIPPSDKLSWFLSILVQDQINQIILIKPVAYRTLSISTLKPVENEN